MKEVSINVVISAPGFLSGGCPLNGANLIPIFISRIFITYSDFTSRTENELIKSNFELTNCRNAVFSNVKKNETSFIFAAIEPSYYRIVFVFLSSLTPLAIKKTFKE